MFLRAWWAWNLGSRLEQKLIPFNHQPNPSNKQLKPSHMIARLHNRGRGDLPLFLSFFQEPHYNEPQGSWTGARENKKMQNRLKDQFWRWVY